MSTKKTAPRARNTKTVADAKAETETDAKAAGAADTWLLGAIICSSDPLAPTKCLLKWWLRSGRRCFAPIWDPAEHYKGLER